MVNSIVTGDALELIPTLEDGSVNLVVTSPPYPGQYGNMMTSFEWVNWYRKWTGLLWDKLTANGILALNIMFRRDKHGWFDDRLFKTVDLAHYQLLDVYIYGKSNPMPNGGLTWCDPPGWEFVMVLTKANETKDIYFEPFRAPYKPKSIRKDGKLYSRMSAQEPLPHPLGARQTTLMTMTKSGDQKRPSAAGISFPRALPERFIRQYTRPDDLVLDPFCGVATTCRVAAELGRRWIGFEIDPAEAERGRAWLAELDPAEVR